MRAAEREMLEERLRANLQSQSNGLIELFESVNDHWGFEDPIYRFYHQSFKVYFLSDSTKQIVASLRQLLPEVPLNPWFMEIVNEGTDKQFKMEDNERWLEVSRPILEAFFHARYFLEMACRYAKAPEKDQAMPSGWTGLLYLFNLR
jgi:hypothetical protein